MSIESTGTGQYPKGSGTQHFRLPTDPGMWPAESGTVGANSQDGYDLRLILLDLGKQVLAASD